MDNIDPNDILKPKDVDPALLKRLENQYGPIDMENDFFKKDLSTYYKTAEITPETNSISHDIIKLASFGDSLKKMSSAVKALKQLMGTKDAKNDQNIQSVARELKDVFNKYRTHLRKNYPDQYNQIKNTLEEINVTGGDGAYLTKYAFRKKGSKPNDGAYKELGYKEVKEGKENPGATLGPGPKATEDGVKDNVYVKNFKYKLVPKPHTSKTIAIVDLSKSKTKPLKENAAQIEEYINSLGIESPNLKKHISDRILGFEKIESKLNELVPLLGRAKQDTMDKYREKQDFTIYYPTDLAIDYLDDTIEMFKNEK